MSVPIKPQHIGDGLYFLDNHYCVEIAVNHHTNVVASLDMSDLDAAINYLTKVRQRIHGNSLDSDTELDQIPF